MNPGSQKERSPAAHHSLPFQRIPKLLMIHIVLNAVKMFNFFPTKGGISDTLSPKTIMSGQTLDYKKHLSLQVEQYCQVHEEDTPCNSQSPRTKGAILLGPGGNLQGGYKFMALNTRKKNYSSKLGCDSHAGYGNCSCECIGNRPT
jgi:hypothetical protein